MSTVFFIFRLISLTLVPVCMSVLLTILQKKWKFFREMPECKKNIIIGVLFGLCAVFGTECGLKTGRAIVNTRDAAVLCAGLFFSSPAAIIAAVIGSVERFLTSMNGYGEYTRLACSISTLLAGYITVSLRKYFIDDGNPKFLRALAIGCFTEIQHLLIVFITRLDDIYVAFSVVRSCAALMILVNGVSVMLSALLISIINKESVISSDQKEINTQFNYGIFVAMLMGFLISMSLSQVFENRLYMTDATYDLSSDISDIEDQAYSASELGADAGVVIIGDSVKYRHIYETGYVVVANGNHVIISDRNGNEGKTLEEVGFDVSKPQDELIPAKVGGEDIFYLFRNVKGYYIVTTVPVSEAKFGRDVSLYVVFFMEMVVFALVFLFVYYLVKKIVLINLKKVNIGLKQITDGDLDTVINVDQNKEFHELSDGINSTVSRLKTLIAEANARIDKELEVAKQIQASSVPTFFPIHEDGEIFAIMDTAKEVGGDFYDFFFVKPRYLYILIADVSGKGIPAALFMMKAKTMIKNMATQTGTTDIGDIFTRVNEALCESNEADMFVTCWMGCVDMKTGHVKFANAGHNNPVIKKSGKTPEFLKQKTDFVLAAMDGMKYETQEFDLEPSDVVYLYTDGFTEAMNAEEELFGNQRLIDALSVDTQNPEEICNKVKTTVDAYIGDADQFDDMTEMAFEFKK